MASRGRAFLFERFAASLPAPRTTKKEQPPSGGLDSWRPLAGLRPRHLPASASFELSRGRLPAGPYSSANSSYKHQPVPEVTTPPQHRLNVGSYARVPQHC
jgi:hypothetical protein